MSEALVTLSPREERLVIELATRFQSTDPSAAHVAVDSLVLDEGESRQDIKNIISKLARFQLLKWHTNASFMILPTLMDVHRQLVTKPTVNHFAEMTNWWFAARWRAVITAMVVVLPLLVQWVEMIQKCSKWFLAGQ